MIKPIQLVLDWKYSCTHTIYNRGRRWMFCWDRWKMYIVLTFKWPWTPGHIVNFQILSDFQEHCVKTFKWTQLAADTFNEACVMYVEICSPHFAHGASPSLNPDIIIYFTFTSHITHVVNGNHQTMSIMPTVSLQQLIIIEAAVIPSLPTATSPADSPFCQYFLTSCYIV